MSWSFHDELMAAWQSAWDEKQRIEQKRLYDATHLTSEDTRAIAKVTGLCTDPALRPHILRAAQNLYRSYVLYQGDDLAPLKHLEYHTRGKVIKDLTNSILAHYGPKFKVTYDDELTTVEITNGCPCMGVTITLSW